MERAEGQGHISDFEFGFRILGKAEHRDFTVGAAFPSCVAPGELSKGSRDLNDIN